MQISALGVWFPIENSTARTSALPTTRVSAGEGHLLLDGGLLLKRYPAHGPLPLLQPFRYRIELLMKSIRVSQNGLSRESLEELAALAAEKVRGDGLRLMGEGGLLPEPAQRLMRAALRPRWTSTWPTRPGQVGGRGARSGGNMRNGYRADKALESMAEWRTRPLDAVYPVVFIDAVRAFANSLN
ncbi:hypothetical protein SAMN04490356_0831 [Streptomyces melanosporofaciens]|uniref:Uncharacterized protein n=1 Tax=Streptomyces melanosporofaciens TaxID=67327 RepID=A0A1H4KNQ7_STRMJ|nr:hypothetical protein [Streptomyces melanosporofaciens]SEB59552.1 hypothetical protein SAMN04490356_0831 [Streptomyces melanosporofaciens]